MEVQATIMKLHEPLTFNSDQFMVYFVSSNQGFANYSLWARCGPLPVFAWPKSLEWFSYFINC